MKKLHQYLGFFMLLPFIAWAVTGVFFFFKPGYKTAYQPLAIKTYPVNQHVLPASNLPEKKEDWLEIRQLKTILGEHLLVKTTQGWQHISPTSLNVIAPPDQQAIKKLVNDAIASNKARYGEIKSVDNFLITTSTDVRITLNWPGMTLRQQGVDTDFINTIYNIHYLRWTGIKALDQVLGVVGLFLMVLLAGLGVMMTTKRQKTV
ncbi:PepSY domain-containing protein [Colwellia sp. 1_MG-2023]|uniref:PepSY domain-containing protein n=1 Tax=Colwellia sp. 1_MG-2023 TaxID=3062649 RepID=UPI0026E14CB0|nr:PepSY domain-containing protein [Colwellia sp. 1_MG-2023]MDO6445900.1 PepSY domain-containing protein [Colwellia sp. 1_MG-2023]